MNNDFKGYQINDEIQRIDFKKVTEWMASVFWSPGIGPGGGGAGGKELHHWLSEFTHRMVRKLVIQGLSQIRPGSLMSWMFLLNRPTEIKGLPKL